MELTGTEVFLLYHDRLLEILNKKKTMNTNPLFLLE